MALFNLLLVRRRRRWRKDLRAFLEGLSLHLYCGYDLAYAWPQVWQALREDLSPEMAGHLEWRTEGLQVGLARLAREYPDPEHRLWFRVVGELYESGAGMGEALQAICRALRAEEERDFESHCRCLPTRLNILLLLFFFPPTLMLLLIPLVMAILDSF